MIEKILWAETGIGQPQAMAHAIAASGVVPVVIVAPAALHQMWRADLDRAGVKEDTVIVMSPQAAHTNGLGEATALVVVDDLGDAGSPGWKVIAGHVRDEKRPVWMRVDPLVYREIEHTLLPSPDKIGATPEEIGNAVEDVLLAHGIESDRSWDEIAVDILDTHPSLAKWLQVVGERWDMAVRGVTPKELLEQAIASSDKQQIVFYRNRADVEGVKGEFLTGSGAEVERLLQRFGNREFKTLLVSPGKFTGWRAPLYADQVDIRFVGTDWDKAEIYQGNLRAKVRELPPVVAEPGVKLHGHQVDLVHRLLSKNTRGFLAMKTSGAAEPEPAADEDERGPRP